jgi:multiple sugar transport system ATP-binding protein
MSGMRLVDITKRFGHHEVVRDVTLDVADGEFLVLVGPSGCGKSTLLRMIAGLEDITSGELWIGGRLANNLTPQQRNIAMVFQSYALFPHMTARENISFGPRIRREPSAEIPSKVERAASILNLHAWLDRLPRQLSGGQRQRVAMGRSIVRDPHVFLFDEPLSNLDAALRVQMRSEIKALHQKLKSTIVYVTHDQIEAMTMADRIVVMSAGTMEQVGAPLDLYDRPANRFVASFLGSPAMSFFEGTVESVNGEASIVLQSGETLRAPAVGAAPGTKVDVGIRPEHFAVSGSGEGLRFLLETVEPTGAETHLHGKIGEADARCVLRERISARPGEQLRLAVSPNNTHLFHGETGARL